MGRPIKFILDLDSTIAQKSINELLSEHFETDSEFESLNRQIEEGNTPFIEGLIKKTHLLNSLSVDKVNKAFENIEIYPQIATFITEHTDDCILVSENASCWFDGFASKTECRLYTSQALVKQNRLKKMEHILRKESIVEKLQQDGFWTVYVGNSISDLEAMRQADISIAAGLNHYPSKRIFPIVDYLVFNENALCRQLNQLL